MPAPTDDEVIVHRYAKRSGGVEDLVGYGNVSSGRGWIARGVIMQNTGPDDPVGKRIAG